MPRRAAADLAVLSPGRPIERLQPPADLTEAARETFLDLVGAVEAAHFQPQDTPLLAAYCRAVEMEREAHRQLRENGHVTGCKPSPWLGVLQQAMKAIGTLSMRLRLSPQGRSPTNPKRSPPMSYYERMAINE